MDGSNFNITEVHKKTLIGNRLKLVRNLCLEEVLQILVMKGILSDDMCERIEAKPTKFSRNVALLTLIPTRGPTAYNALVQSLRESDQCHLADMLVSYENHLISGIQRRKRVATSCFPYSCAQGYHTGCHDNLLTNSPASNLSTVTYIEYDNCRKNLQNEKTDTHDGPQALFVTKTTVEFYKATHNISYSMTCRPRGYALIICVSKFDSGVDFPDRNGSEIDKRNLTALLHQLEFITVLAENCNIQAMQDSIKSFSQRVELQSTNCCIVVVLSHGEAGYIYGSDGRKLSINYLLQSFDNSNCPSLQNKPKIFLIQACRNQSLGGDVRDGKTLTFQDYSDGIMETTSLQMEERSRLPTCSDTIIGYATLAGGSAMRNTRHGSWYIQAFVKIMSKHAKDKDFAEILTLVNGSLRAQSREEDGLPHSLDKHTPEFYSSLCKKLFFYPGIVAKM